MGIEQSGTSACGWSPCPLILRWRRLLSPAEGISFWWWCLTLYRSKSMNTNSFLKLFRVLLSYVSSGYESHTIAISPGGLPPSLILPLVLGPPALILHLVLSPPVGPFLPLVLGPPVGGLPPSLIHPLVFSYSFSGAGPTNASSSLILPLVLGPPVGGLPPSLIHPLVLLLFSLWCWAHQCFLLLFSLWCRAHQWDVCLLLLFTLWC